jgi:hypothetical protein
MPIVVVPPEGGAVSEAPAETLRRAAKLIRERAGGCEPRRWHWTALGEKRYPQQVRSDGNVAIIAECYIDPVHRPYEAEHIASWHPLVALAVADLLEGEAWHADGGEDGTDHVASLPYQLARTYLGEENP